MKKLLLLLPVMLLQACAIQPNAEAVAYKPTPYTHGNVQLTLKRQITTQAEVLEKFGAPNIATIDSQGLEVWTYQKNATIASAQTSSSYGTVILFGGSNTTSGFEQSSRTMTLVIKFDSDKKVVDFRSMTSLF